MRTGIAVLGLSLIPILAVAALMELAGWLQRRRDAAIARQVALTDAIASELGAVVAPVVKRPLWGPWLIEIAVPFSRPATIARVLSIAHRVLCFAGRRAAGPYRIVLTPQEEPARGGAVTPSLRAA
jgi:hypothetical protein